MKKLSIIIPAFNEQATVKQLINQVKRVKLPKKIKKQIIVIDDGSTDKTKSIIKKIPRIDKIYLKKNQGKGAAVHAGLKLVDGDYCLIQDADLEYDPQDIKALIKPILDKKAQVVYGSRFLGPHKNMLFWHFLGNKMLTFLANILYNTTLSDMEVCYKLLPTKLFKSLNLNQKGFSFDPELTVKVLKKGYRIFEVPISYAGREFHEGKKITWKDGFMVLYILFRFRILD